MVYNCNMKGLGKLRSWVEMNVLYIADRDHQRGVIVVDYPSKFKAI